MAPSILPYTTFKFCFCQKKKNKVLYYYEQNTQQNLVHNIFWLNTKNTFIFCYFAKAYI